MATNSTIPDYLKRLPAAAPFDPARYAGFAGPEPATPDPARYARLAGPEMAAAPAPAPETLALYSTPGPGEAGRRSPLDVSKFAGVSEGGRYTSANGEVEIRPGLTVFTGQTGRNMLTSRYAPEGIREDKPYAPPAYLGGANPAPVPYVPPAYAMPSPQPYNSPFPPVQGYGGGRPSASDSARDAMEGASGGVTANKPLIPRAPMNVSQWAAVNSGRDKTRIARLGLQYAGSGDAFTPQGIASRNQMASIYAREQGDTARQNAGFDNAARMEDLKRRWALEDNKTKLVNDLILKTGYGDPNEAAGALRAQTDADIAGKRTTTRKGVAEATQAERDAAARAQGGMTDAERVQRDNQEYARTGGGRDRGETPAQTSARLRAEDEAKARTGAAGAVKAEREVEDLDLGQDGFPVTRMQDGIVFGRMGGKWKRLGSAAVPLFPPTGSGTTPADQPNLSGDGPVESKPEAKGYDIPANFPGIKGDGRYTISGKTGVVRGGKFYPEN